MNRIDDERSKRIFPLVFKALPVFEDRGLGFSEHLDMKAPLFATVWGIYTAAFSDCERRVYAEQKTIHDHPRYRFSAIMQGDVAVGVLACWLLQGFWFVEHFAIASEHRSSGLGGRALGLLQEHVRGPILLDVEPLGTDKNAMRRVAFYTRLGFHYCDKSVTLPPYQGRRASPSNLMAWPRVLDCGARDRALATVEREIYALDRCPAGSRCAV